MIFVTVGAQMPFDRLIRGVDEWAGANNRRDIFAQIGESNYRPRHIQYSRFIDPAQFRGTIEQANVIVAHAGMGSIISAVELGKPILVMPRRGDLGETRNDHQVATAKRFSSLRLVEVAADELELARKLDEIDELIAGKTACERRGNGWAACTLTHDGLGSSEEANNHACPHLLTALKAFFAGQSPFEAVAAKKTQEPRHLVVPSLVEVHA